jgi:hypothetical protein
MKTPIVLILLILFSYAVPAQRVAAIADKNKIYIGEQIQVQVFADFYKGQQPAWFRTDSLPHFEVLNTSDIDTIKNADTITLKQTLTITSWDSGSWNFPSIAIGPAATAPFKIDVGYSPMDPKQDYHDIKDIVPVKKPSESKWHWYVILVMVLIALFMLFFPPEKKKEQPAFVTDVGAYQKAMNDLDELDAGKNQDDKLFYTTLVNVLRTYLHRRKNLRSFSKTTDDLAIQMKQLNIDQELYNPLLQTLRLSDLVKYARFKPSGEDKSNAVSIMRKTIMTIEDPNAV